MDPHHHLQRPPQGPPGGPAGGPPFYPGGPPPGAMMAPPPGGPFGVPPPFRPPMIPFLPPGWTEHRAPDGMAYFYNAATGQSSWVRPTPPPLPAGAPGMPPPLGVQHFPPPGFHPGHQHPPPPGLLAAGSGPAPEALESTSSSKEDPSATSKKSKKAKKEKAVKKVQVLDSPWFIVTTSHDNTFYYNKESKSSIWIPTTELEILLAKMGQVEMEKRKAEADRLTKEEQDRLSASAVGTKRSNEENLSKEDAEKRSKTDNSTAGQDTNVGTEMTEEDVAWQLAAMEDVMDDQDQDEDMQSQGDDSEDDADVQARLQKLQKESQAPSWAQNLDISEDNIQEREMLFLNMMRDRGVTQFDTWERAFSKIERDPRMYLIPGKKDRQALFDSFCTIRAQEIRDAKEKKEQEEREEAERKDKKDKERHQHGSRRDSSSKLQETSKSEVAIASISKPEAIYRRLMEEYSTKTSTWLDFMTKYRVDPRFLALKPGSLRESIFRKYLSDLKKGILPTTKASSSSSTSDDKKRSSHSSSSSSKKYKATKDEIDEFMSLLKETKKDILYEHKHSSSVEWKKIKRAIDRDRRYDAVGSSTEREMLFREYADKVIQRRD